MNPLRKTKQKHFYNLNMKEDLNGNKKVLEKIKTFFLRQRLTD